MSDAKSAEGKGREKGQACGKVLGRSALSQLAKGPFGSLSLPDCAT